MAHKLVVWMEEGSTKVGKSVEGDDGALCVGPKNDGVGFIGEEGQESWWCC